MKDDIFEQNWKESLNKQFKKTNYWFALPTKNTETLDAVELYPSDTDFPKRWIHQLLGTSLAATDIRPQGKTADTLKAFYHEHRSNTHKKYAFGYPLLVMKDESGQRPFVAAPLFLWQMHLETVAAGFWKLARIEHTAAVPNELVIQHLENQGLNIRAAFEKAMDGRDVDGVFLQNICIEINAHFSFDTSLDLPLLTPCPSFETLESVAKTSGGIVWSGVFGLFEPLPDRFLKKINRTDISTEIPNTTTNEILNPEIEISETEVEAVATLKPQLSEVETKGLTYRKHHFAATALQPQQAALLRKLATERRLTVRTAAHTGLIELVTGIVTNTLAHGGKTLIVSAFPELLQRAQAAVNAHYGGDILAVELSDLQTQKAVFYNTLRLIAESTKKHVPFLEEDYQVAVNVAKRLETKLDATHEALNKPLFRGKNWVALIGEFLQKHGVQGRQLLNSQVNAANYTFNDENYDALREMIKRGLRLFQGVNTLKHPLEVLHHDIFRNKNLAEAKTFTTTQIDEHAAAVTVLYQEFVLKIEEYAEALQNLYEVHHDLLHRLATEIQDAISDNQHRFGENFNKINIFNTLKLKLYGLFSERFRHIAALKKQTLEKYQTLKNTHYNKRQLDYNFIETSGAPTFAKISRELDDLKIALRNWKHDFPMIVHNEVQRLSAQTTHPDLEFRASIEALNARLRETIAAFNAATLYREDYETSDAFVINNRGFLERIMDQLESLQFNLRDFEAYFDWKTFWLDLPSAQQQLLKAFIVTKPEKWELAFDSWFLHQILLQHETEAIPNNSQVLEQYFDNNLLLKKLLTDKAKNYWTHRRAASLRALKRSNSNTFNTYFNKKTPSEMLALPLDGLLEKHHRAVIDLVPVICTTPNIANNYFEENSFEQVIILEADSLKITDGYPLLKLGYQAIVTGAGSLKRLENEETLMEYASDNFQTVEITMETTAKPVLSDFVNRAFFKGRLQKGLNSSNFKTELQHIEGYFDATTQQNRLEAKAIIELLQQLYNENSRYLPKVGIVCCTKKQRNLLLEQLSAIQKNKTEGHEKIAHFVRNGLTVCTLADAVGKRFDLVIFGTTFSKNDHVDTDFNFLNGEFGVHLLQNLWTNTADGLFVYTSLAQDFIEENRYTYSNSGLNLLCNFLDYLNAQQLGSSDQITSILNGLHSAVVDREFPENGLATAVKHRLATQIDAARIQDVVYLDPAKIDFWVNAAHENQPPLAAVIDGFFWRFPKGDYFWEQQLQTALKNEGFDVRVLWSSDWWKYPEKMPAELAEIIQKADKQHEPKTDETVAETVEITALNVADDTTADEITEENATESNDI